MPRGSRALLLSVLLTLVVVVPVRAESDEIESEGVARVVGRNVVTARARALRRAQQAALVECMRRVLVEDERLAVGRRDVQQRVTARPPVYLRTYRVLEERQEGAEFRLRVAALCDVARMRRELRERAGLGLGRGESAPVASPAIGLWIDARKANDVPGWEVAASSAATEKAIRLQAQSAGIRLVLVGGPADDAMAQARRSGLVALLQLQIHVAAAAQVRGLDLPAARAEVALKLVSVGGRTTELETWRAVRWVAAAAAERAAHQGVMEAMNAVAAPLAAALKRRWPRTAVGERELLFHVTGLVSLAQQQRFCRLIEQRGRGVESCRLRRLARDQALINVHTTASAAAVAAVLTADKSPGLIARVERIEGRRLWVVLAGGE